MSTGLAPMPRLLFRNMAIVTRMNVPSPFRSKEHLDSHNHHHSAHGYEPRHGGIPFVPERREAWVGQGYKRRRQEMHESRRYEDAGPEMPR